MIVINKCKFIENKVFYHLMQIMFIIDEILCDKYYVKVNYILSYK